MTANTPNRAALLSDEEEERLWASGALGDTDPEALLHAMWFTTTKCLGFRGCNESRQLKWGDLTEKKTLDGTAYLEWNERLTKTREGYKNHSRPFAPKLFANTDNPSRCPVRLYNLYQSHRPAGAKCDAFYLGINHNRTSSPVSPWYLDAPMGVNRIAKIMSRTAARAGVTGKVTNHSVRRTMLTQLYQRGVPPTMIAQLSGHKNVSSLNHYAVASLQQQQQMCNMLQNPLQNRRNFMNEAVTEPMTPVLAATPVAPVAPTLLQPAPAETAPALSQVAATNIVNQTTGLAGLFANAQLNGPITININISN